MFEVISTTAADELIDDTSAASASGGSGGAKSKHKTKGSSLDYGDDDDMFGKGMFDASEETEGSFM